MSNSVYVYVFLLSDIYNSKDGKFQIKTTETTAAGFWVFLQKSCLKCYHVLLAVLESFMRFAEGRSHGLSLH